MENSPVRSDAYFPEWKLALSHHDCGAMSSDRIEMDGLLH